MMSVVRCLYYVPIIFMAACLAEAPETKEPDITVPVAIGPQADALSRFIQNTPYAALVVDTNITAFGQADEFGDVTYLYEANVIDTYRGAKLKKLQYQKVMEGGDPPEVTSTPYIVTLCKNDSGYNWHGLGASMDAQPGLKALAQNVGAAADKSQTDFNICD